VKNIYIVFIITTLAVGTLAYNYTKQDFGYHIHYISQKNSLRGYMSEMWLKTCPKISQESVEPNSAFGIVVAGREMLDDKFDFVMNILNECGHDINQRDSIGLTPLHSAILFSDLIAIQTVISLGANTKLMVAGNAAEKYGEIGYFEYAKKLGKTEPEIIGYLSKLP
jgi:hypothetical protein